MRILCDTNVLVRSVKQDDPDHDVAVQSLITLRSANREIILVPQCLYEFYSVATRPAAQNGLGMTPDTASILLERFLRLMPLLRDERRIYERWFEIVKDYEVKGKQTHDARLVAAMERHQIVEVITFNDAHFRRYKNLTVLTPQSVADPTS